MPATLAVPEIATAASREEMRGVGISNITMTEALDAIESRFHGDGCTQVSFVNADCLNKAAEDSRYRSVLQRSWLVLPDGIGVKMAGKLLGFKVRDNVNGTDMFPLLCQRLSARSGSIFLLGARPGVPDAVAQWIRRNFPEVVISGVIDGFRKDDEAIVAEINAASPDVLLVAKGAPLQEMWIAEHRDSLDARICIGVGGLFDFFSGRIPRAPRWMRRSGTEWVYRLYQEPQRMWRRYLLGNFLFIANIMLERISLPRTQSVPE
jgi:N-acetylglucosaminyldiphosphoundecaprenol N-acetyl-beta-D-mannosaminyltransferase